MKTRILVVDDDRSLRTAVSQVLRNDGHEVVEAATAEQALQLFREDPFRLVLTNLVMEKMSGLDLLKEIRIQDPESLVVIMSSHPSLEVAVEALRSGAYDFLIKPFEDIQLISAFVQRAVDRIKLNRNDRELLQRLKRYVGKLEALSERLRTLANRDGLTELANHRFFRESLEVELARAARHSRVFSLVFLDVDRFKHYNDVHGHLAGDALLKAFAKMLRQNSRKSDLVARYGGEEFVILLPETDSRGATLFADRLGAAVAAHTFVDEKGGTLGKVTISLGVASFPDHATDASTLIERADRALYLAKQAGRNRAACWDEVRLQPV